MDRRTEGATENYFGSSPIEMRDPDGNPNPTNVSNAEATSVACNHLMATVVNQATLITAVVELQRPATSALGAKRRHAWKGTDATAARSLSSGLPKASPGLHPCY